MQFLDGGSLVEHHAKRVMHAQALQAAGSVSSTRGVTIGDVFRDANGQIWWDQEEEWEYAHLLADRHRFDDDWVRFTDGKENVSPHAHEEEHRGSISTESSHLSLRKLVLPASEDDLVAFGAPLTLYKPGASVLALPRPRRFTTSHAHSHSAASHGHHHQLRSPRFLLGLDHLSPCSPTTAARFPAPASAGKGKKHCRRPAPLKLAPVGRGVQGKQATNSPVDARREFVEGSFVSTLPLPVSVSTGGPVPKPVVVEAEGRQVVRKMPSRMGVRGLFE
jgi:hypothetical protein